MLAISGLVAWAVERETGRPAETPVRAQPEAQQENINHRALGVLRAERASADHAPDRVRQAVEAAALMGENPSLSRKALETNFDRTYYVIPGHDEVVCLVTNTGASLCGPVEGALTAKLGGTEACAPGDPTKYIVWGMVPDAAKQPEVVFEDGRVERLRAPKNVYAFTVERAAPPPVTLRWRYDSRSIEAPVPLDSGVRSAVCAMLPAV
jgi:hypothetical protein